MYIFVVFYTLLQIYVGLFISIRTHIYANVTETYSLYFHPGRERKT